MKKTDYDHLFFSRTRDFLDINLSKQCSRRPHTVKTYRDALTVFQRYVTHQGISLKRFSFKDCTRDFMLRFMEYLLQKGYERATCNQRLAAIKAYLWYVADKTIDYQQIALAVSHVPFLKNPKKVKEVISEEYLKSLLSAPEHSKIGIRDTTIMVILYDSAIRLSELLNLKISDINLQKSTPYLRIHDKEDKERIVSISENTVAYIKQNMRYYHEEAILTMDYLFYTIIHGHLHPMSPDNVERIINKYAAMIRTKHPYLSQKVHPHMFRRTRAADLY